MVGSGHNDPHGTAADRAIAVSHALLCALLDELGAERANEHERRRLGASRALQLVPWPAALFAGARALDSVSNAAWRATFEQVDAWPRRIGEAIATVRALPSSHHTVELEAKLRDHAAHFAVALRLLADHEGVVVVALDITEQVIARRLGADRNALAWSGPPGGAPMYYGERWRTEVGSGWHAAIHPSDAPRWIAALAEIERGRDLAETELRLRMKHGSFVWHRVRLAPGRDEVIGCAVDIDRERRDRIAHDELVQQLDATRDEVERANRLKDRVLSALGHELRGPLAALSLWERVLRDHNDEDDARRRALDAIRDGVAEQSRLVTDLLDLARGLGGDLHIDVRTIDVERIVAEAVSAARTHARAKSIDLVSIVTTPPGPVRADGARMKQIIGNLLSNAIKFTDANGKVTVTTSTRDGVVTIEVQDSGRGLAADALARVFEPFHRVEGVLAHGERRIGLGLAIAKLLVNLHRGTLDATSDGPGTGSTFTLTLPCANLARGEAGEPDVQPLRNLHGARVLIIDDDVRTRDALTLILQREGIVVETASSVDGGRACIAAAEPQAVICDLAMPGEDGYSFVRELRAAGRAIPSIALTGYATSHDVQHALDAGFDVHLAKPISVGALLDRLSDLLSGTRSVSGRRIT
ncbi:MAG TPA: ATP-binding protein [Kofleriaceae bacterium]|nr:ATP-binding protein [Kofleriaceae bacterium]